MTSLLNENIFTRSGCNEKHISRSGHELRMGVVDVSAMSLLCKNDLEGCQEVGYFHYKQFPRDIN